MPPPAQLKSLVVKLFKEAAELRRTGAALRDEIARLREGCAVGVLRWVPQSRTL